MITLRLHQVITSVLTSNGLPSTAQLSTRETWMTLLSRMQNRAIYRPVSKVIWHEAALPSSHPSRQQFCPILTQSSTWCLGLTRLPPKRYLDRYSRFAQLIRVPNTLTDTYTDIQTTLRATSVAIGRIFATTCRRCGIKYYWFQRQVKIGQIGHCNLYFIKWSLL